MEEKIMKLRQSMIAAEKDILYGSDAYNGSFFRWLCMNKPELCKKIRASIRPEYRNGLTEKGGLELYYFLDSVGAQIPEKEDIDIRHSKKIIK